MDIVLDIGSNVWLRNEKNDQIFTFCEITDITRQGVVVKDKNDNNIYSVTHDKVFPACEEEKNFQDCCTLKHLNIATILKNLRARFDINEATPEIYTYANFFEMKKTFLTRFLNLFGKLDEILQTF